MANYIHHLQDTVKEHVADKVRAVESINTFKKHLNTPKFWDDTTIQIADVFRYLHDIEVELDLRRESIRPLVGSKKSHPISKSGRLGVSTSPSSPVCIQGYKHNSYLW